MMAPPPPPRTRSLDAFLIEATIAGLRRAGKDGGCGLSAACDAITAAETLAREAGVKWDREVPR